MNNRTQTWMIGSNADSTLTSMSSPRDAVRSLCRFLILAATRLLPTAVS